ncbi:MAG TPA: PepSY domain-containing protein, partial [Janthinobacterium sp.]|nr:PepSY domain-containing protein [Janthinobacterium sp.]
MKPTTSLFARRVSLFWRIHFWAALIASPFALVAALTGILYIFTPQIEAALYRGLEQTTPAVVMRPLDEAVAAATAAAPPGWDLLSVAPAYRPGDTVKLVFAPGVATPG